MARKSSQHQLLEQALEHVLNIGSPWGRLSAAMSVASSSSLELLIPYPPYAARKISDLKVRDTARGARHIWTADFAWEGTTWLQALEASCPATTSTVRVLGYLSEPPEIRRQLALEAQAALQRRDVRALVNIRSSYKPALFWLLEEVLPILRQNGADRLVMRYPVVPNTSEVRFLQEFYPASSLLEREGIQLELLAAPRADPVYEASAFIGKHEVWHDTCLAPQAERIQQDQIILSPTAWLEVQVNNDLLVQQRILTDGERFWSWYEDVVLPQILVLSPSAGPFFQSLTVTAKLSEPDLALSIQPERVSMLEALSEEVYFSTLEAFQRHANAPIGGRGLKVGKIVPLFTEHLGQAGFARVTLILLGTGELGVMNQDGTVQLAPFERISAQVTKQANKKLSVLVSGTPDALQRLERHHALESVGIIPKWESTGLTNSSLIAQSDLGKRHLDASSKDNSSLASSLPGGLLSAQDIWQETKRLAQLPGVSSRVVGRSLEGRPIHAISRLVNPNMPSLLVTAGQHANEPTGPKAALILLEEWLSEGSINVVGMPLKNPDGLRLYRALRQVHPEHMHHPARYTALGVDVQAISEFAIPEFEGAALNGVLKEFRPRVHLNLHGYPAHEWTRPYTGYAPRGFELWAIPMGAMVIVVHDKAQKNLARELATTIAADLGADTQIRETTLEALRQRAPHVHQDPFELIGGLPFQFWEREAKITTKRLPSTLEERGTITVITEMPDETVYGQRFELGVRTQVLIGQSVARWLELEVQ